MVAKGVSCFRINLSHGSQKEKKEYFSLIDSMKINDSGIRPPILADLAGPKVRVRRLERTIFLEEGDSIIISSGKRGDGIIPVSAGLVFNTVESGSKIMINDGKVSLKVIKKISGEAFECETLIGGKIKGKKGVNFIGITLNVPSLTKQDEEDLELALKNGADWIALSFVQRPSDIVEARRLISGRAAVMAKIEKPTALHQIEKIIELSDAIMVARGDLGVELPVEEVPVLQKDLVRRARRAGKPVVVATQMLESMVIAPVPTRAEVSDVATAVYDGTDAVMLSGETATGSYPLEAVEVMSRVAAGVEVDPSYRSIMDNEHADPEATSADAITAAARQVAGTISASAIVTYTTSGSTALRAARERPPVPILVLTPSKITARRLSVAWGLSCVHSADASGFADMVDRACRVAADQGIATTGDLLVITAGVPFGTPGATNSLRIASIP